MSKKIYLFLFLFLIILNRLLTLYNIVLKIYNLGWSMSYSTANGMENQECSNTLTNESSIKIGELLKLKRREFNLTLEEVAAATRINIRYIRAIEESKLNKMLTNVYQIGYIKNYANFLCMDVEHVLERYRTEFALLPNANGKAIVMKNDANIPFLFDGFRLFSISIAIVAIGLSILAMDYRMDILNIAKETIDKKFHYDLSKILGSKNESETRSITSFHQPHKNVIISSGNMSNVSIFQPSQKGRTEDDVIVVAEKSSNVKIFDKQSRLIIEKKVNPGDVMFLPNDNRLFVNSANSGINLYHNASLELFSPQATIIESNNNYKTYFINKYSNVR